MLSQVPANARLGFLVVLGLAGCFVFSLLMLPVLLNWWPLGRENGEGRRKSGKMTNDRADRTQMTKEARSSE
jgi:predicted RND superfamily exporter protein